MNHSTTELRKKLLGELLFYKKANGHLNPIPTGLLRQYRYFEQRYLLVQMIITDLVKLYPEQVTGGGEYIHERDSESLQDNTLFKLIRADLNSVPIAAAVIAWISWDHWRFSDEDLNHENLNYGLILSYPSIILRAACYTSGVTAEEELDFMIPIEVQKKADLFAIQEISTLRKIPQEELRKNLFTNRKRILSL